MALLQGIFRLGSPETRVQVYRQIYYNSSRTYTSESLLTMVINTVLYLVLTMYCTGTSQHYHIFINITVCHVRSPARMKARKLYVNPA